MKKVRVVFIKYNHQILAVFPEFPGNDTNRNGNPVTKNDEFACCTRSIQNASIHPTTARECKRATVKEYALLQINLEKKGLNLDIRKRLPK